MKNKNLLLTLLLGTNFIYSASIYCQDLIRQDNSMLIAHIVDSGILSARDIYNFSRTCRKFSTFTARSKVFQQEKKLNFAMGELKNIGKDFDGIAKDLDNKRPRVDHKKYFSQIFVDDLNKHIESELEKNSKRFDLGDTKKEVIKERLSHFHELMTKKYSSTIMKIIMNSYKDADDKDLKIKLSLPTSIEENISTETEPEDPFKTDDVISSDDEDTLKKIVSSFILDLKSLNEDDLLGLASYELNDYYSNKLFKQLELQATYLLSKYSKKIIESESLLFNSSDASFKK